jgi:hypothetical protein
MHCKEIHHQAQENTNKKYNMKKLFYTFLLLFVNVLLFAQSPVGNQVSGSIDNGPSANMTSLYVRTLSAFDANKVDNLVYTVRVPISAGNAITLSISNIAPAFAHISFAIQRLNVTDGVYNYYLVNGTGNIQAAAGTVVAANVPFRVLDITYSGGVVASSAGIQLVDDPDDIPGNAYIRPQFYIQNNLGDFTNYDLMFYATGAGVAFNSPGQAGVSFVGTAGLVVLPVKFLNFTAVKKQASVELNWTVENEGPLTDRYEVERSTNGRDFTTEYIVDARNNGATSNIYLKEDLESEGLKASNNVLFYRIKQYDHNGQFAYSDTRNVRFDKSSNISLYPNPVATKAKLTVDLEKGKDITVQIFDATGKALSNTKYRLVKGFNIQEVDFSSYPAGKYNVVIDDGESVNTIRVIKTN